MTGPRPLATTHSQAGLVALVVSLSVLLVVLVVGLALAVTRSGTPTELSADRTATTSRQTLPVTSSSASAVTSTAPPTTAPTTAPPTVAPTTPRPPVESFYGEWSVHGGTTTFRPDGTGVSKNHEGFTNDDKWLDEVLAFNTSLSDDGKQLTATIVSVSYSGNGEPMPNYRPAYPSSFSVGDTFAVTFEHPHLLKVTAIKAKSPGLSFGNPYLCGQGLATQYQNLCGA